MPETDPNGTTNGTVAETQNGADGESGQAIPKAAWTIMIYQAGDNDLSHDSVRALSALREVQTADRIHVVAQFDPSGPQKQTRRLVINKKDKTKKSGAAAAAAASGEPGDELSPLAGDKVEGLPPGEVLFPGGRRSRPPRATRSGGSQTPTNHPDDGETNSADPETLFDFISWTKSNFPGRRYMLILAGHSAGVESGFLLKDENPAATMSFQDLKEVLQAVQNPLGINLDILGFDACLMSMIEICYELKGLANFIVGAQGLVPGPGWPYQRIVRELDERVQAAQAGGGADGVKIEAEDIAPILVDQYIGNYLDEAVIGGLSVDLAALRMAETDAVIAALASLAEVLTGKLGERAFNDALILAHWEAQSYNGELFVDLCDLCELVKTRIADAAIRTACGAVQTAVSRMVLRSCFCGVDFQYSNGLSIYFPWASIFAGYKELEFAKDGGAAWLQFLQDYVRKTRREVRGTEAAIMSFTDFRLDPPWRKDPPYHGPYGTVHSMRNPPVDYPRVTKCIEANPQQAEHLKGLLDTFSLK